MRYAGLTDDPERRKQDHGNPRDFRVVRELSSERQGREWEEQMLAQGYKGDVGGAGWRYGYTYAV